MPPDLYTSTATLLVVQQQVPERYVVPNSTTDVTSALQAMKQEVLSRTQLLRMITDFGLYPKQRKHLAPEELVSLMLSHIDIVPTNNPQPQQREKAFDAFRISFTTENAFLAQQVTNNLTSLFINEYLRTGTEHATNTTSFLDRQVEEKSKELEAQETRLKDFKLSHIGELPEQQAGNLGILSGLQRQLENTESSLARAQQQRILWQAQLDATPRRHPGPDATNQAILQGYPNNPQLLTPLQSAQNNLVLLETQKSTLMGKGYTTHHPDVQRNQRDIAQAEAAVNRLKAITPPPERTASSASRLVEPAEDPAVAQLKKQPGSQSLGIESLTGMKPD